MKISVIIPVYNCELYIERCIYSILEQTYVNLEIICVNDGSNDNSGKILDKLACEDSRIRVIHQANAGASAARNTGIDAATGDLVTFVDSDDAIEPDMYEILLPYFADENVDIVHCGYKRMYLDGSSKEVNGTGRLVQQSTYEAAEHLLSGKLFVGSLCNKLYRVQLLKGVQFDTTLAINEDVLGNAVLFRKANESVFLDVGKYLVYERVGSASSVTKEIKKISDSVLAAEKMLAVYKDTPAERAAEERVLNTQIGLYRWYVMNTLDSSREERRNLAEKIDAVLKKRKDNSSRQRLNFALMRYVPVLYKLAYSLYDRIRVPNWDVEE